MHLENPDGFLTPKELKEVEKVKENIEADRKDTTNKVEENIASDVQQLQDKLDQKRKNIEQ